MRKGSRKEFTRKGGDMIVEEGLASSFKKDSGHYHWLERSLEAMSQGMQVALRC